MKASTLICCLMAVVAGGAPAAAQIKGYPHQTIKIVVPFARGGGVDAVARLMAERLGSELSVPVIVENRALLAKYCVLSFKPALRLERQSQASKYNPD